MTHWIVAVSGHYRSGTLRRLHLLRHAKSSWDDPALSDHERPLAKRGRKASRKIAAHLAGQRNAPDLVLCSSAVRSVETLERIREGFPHPPEESIEPGLYGAGPAELIDRINLVPGEVGSLMLIGHNPAIQQLALILAGDGEAAARARLKLPTGALATLELPCPWRELGPGSSEMVSFVRPKEL